MARELVAAFDAAEADDDVRVVLMTGAGRAFCAGADLGRGARTFDATDPVWAAERAGFETIGGVPRDGGGTVSLRIAASRKPVIVAVNGPAVGVGATMTLPADVRIAGQSARFGFVFARRGLVPEAASSWFLPRVVGISQAMEWVATGRVFDAAEALGGRLVSRVLPDDELLPAARALAAEIAENTSAVSVALARQLMWSMLGSATPWEAHRLDSLAMFRLGQSADAVEGVTSFLEKRPPKFPGRVDDFADVVPLWPLRPETMD
jgi:enoyl-CoA hydratase/carnithine racemase